MNKDLLKLHLDNILTSSSDVRNCYHCRGAKTTCEDCLTKRLESITKYVLQIAEQENLVLKEE